MDLRPQVEAIQSELPKAWQSIIDRSAFSGGEETAAFERAWERYLGVPHAIGCSDGTTAIVLALRGAMSLRQARVDPEDEVITAPTSFFASAEGIALAGAKPVFADVAADSGNLVPELVERAITVRTRAILAVHLAGRPAPMAELRDIATRRGLLLVEDAAQAHGATLGGARIGTIGDAACFSFYPTKNLGAFGEGGCVTTASDDVAACIRRLRDHGQDTRHHHVAVGYNARLDGLQSAVLRLKLAHLDRWNAERQRLATRYREQLGDLPLGLPSVQAGATHVYHLFPIRTPRREALVRFLTERGIGTGSHYPVPIHLQPAFASLGYGPGSFPNAETYAAEQLSLPLYPGLAPAAVDEVAAAIRDFFGGQ